MPDREPFVRFARPADLRSIPSATGGIARLACARMRDAGKGMSTMLSGTGLTAAQLNEAYQLAIVMEKDNRLSFYVGLTLLALTVISWIVHSARRAYRRGQPLLVPAIDVGRSAEMPSAARRAEPPIALKPLD